MFSKDLRINMHIDNGLFNGKVVYIHYTSLESLNAIKKQRKISANPNRERRGIKAKKGVYLALAKDAMNGRDAHNLLFLGEESLENEEREIEHLRAQLPPVRIVSG